MRIGWLGFHLEGIPALRAVLKAGHAVECVMTLEHEQLRKRSGSVDYGPLCIEHSVPLHRIRNINHESSLELLSALQLDVLFVIGWSQIVRKAAMERVRLGLVGAHASLLPRNRGSAPVNWVLIKGERTTGNTLMWLSEGVDSGDIIDSRQFDVSIFDTCATIYDKVAESNRDMILALWPKLLRNEVPRRPQPATDDPVLPRRRPADGLLDWSAPGKSIYDMVRALTRPYPGAFTWMRGQRWRIWAVALAPATGAAPGAPGEVLGPALSPVAEACGLAVACGDGMLTILEMESDEGEVVKGYALCEREWGGEVLTGAE